MTTESTIPRNALIAEYLLSGNADDTSGGAHHGVVHGATPTQDRFGRAHQALAFDGTAWIEVSPSPVVNLAAYSVSVWAKFDRRQMHGWTNCIIAQDNGDDDDQSRRNFQLSCEHGRVIWHRMMQTRDPMYGRRVRPGEWYHFVGVAANGEHTLYADGVLQDSVAGGVTAAPGQPLHIGRKGTDERYFFFKGAIDDVRVYNRALTADEVAALFRENGFNKRAPLIGDVSGRWGRDGTAVLILTHDGNGRVTGEIMGGTPSNMAPIENGTFDRSTGRFVLTGRAKHHEKGTPVDFRLEGTVDGDEVAVAADFVERNGDWAHHRNYFLSKRGARRRLWQDSALRAWLMGPMIRVRRMLWARSRPSKAANVAASAARGDRIAEFVIRDAVVDDVPALSQVHVTAWNATYNTSRGPTVAVREWQWREMFAKPDPHKWFLLVVTTPGGEIVGFTRGIRRDNGTGDFNKLYLLTEYQRLGLGTRLVRELVHRFLSMGITRMSGYVEPGNPSGVFFEWTGGHWERDDNGRVNPTCYVWDDLNDVARKLGSAG